MENVTIDKLINNQIQILEQPIDKCNFYALHVYDRLEHIEKSVDDDFRSLIKSYNSQENFSKMLSTLKNISKIQLMSTKRLINIWKRMR